METVDEFDPAVAVSNREASALPTRRPRIESVDMLRGLLMILMALDHTREYFSRYLINPVDPLHSWPALFATRWVTHLCAPGFVALAGTSVYLQRQRGKSSRQLADQLVTRGLWLIYLEFTVISFAWSFTRAPFLQIIWAIGVSMVGLSALMRLPTAAIGAIGATIVLFHNLLDPISASRFGAFANVWKLIDQPGFLFYHDKAFALAPYPALPWFGIICLGYAFGALVATPAARRSRITLRLASYLFTAFVLLRFVHGYGDPFPFVHLATPQQTAMSFFDLQKYPPSLQFVLATFSVLLLLFYLFDAIATRNLLPYVRTFFQTYGRVPFFFYVLHIYLIHATALVWTAINHGDWRYWTTDDLIWKHLGLIHWGFALPGVYAIWLAFVLVLYFPCDWFGRLKARRQDWWLSYL
jgi:uncharacterized membrane protein